MMLLRTVGGVVIVVVVVVVVVALVAGVVVVVEGGLCPLRHPPFSCIQDDKLGGFSIGEGWGGGGQFRW